MKNQFIVALGLLMMLVRPGICIADNPIVQTRFTADPAPMVYHNTVYLYTSHDENDATSFKMNNWLCYTTTDMVNWTDHGAVASLKDFRWASPHVSGWGGFENGAWAPQCIERDGKFYMYCPVQGRGIGVLVANNPLGPFVDPLGKSLIGPQFDSIDPTVFVDDDGQAYLYWGNPNLWYVKLNRDMVSFSGEPVKDSSFTKVQGHPDHFHYQEGPWFYKRQGHYYMVYASTCCPEGIGYAMSTGPTGPWTFKGYVMEPSPASSGNHPGVIDFKGRSYVFGFNYYLNYLRTNVHRERRSVCIEQFTYNPDGTIPTLPWWPATGPPQIGTLDPYHQTRAATICWESGVHTEPCAAGGMDVCDIGNDSYIKVKGVNFGRGAMSLDARVASEQPGGKIEVRLDSPAGPLVGFCVVPTTGGLQKWTTVSSPIRGATGTHDLYFRFTGRGSNLFNFDWWLFHRRSHHP
jgi:hypothetical protein